MLPGVVISFLLVIWMFSAGGNGKSNKPTGKTDIVGKIVSGNNGYIIIQKKSAKAD